MKKKITKMRVLLEFKTHHYWEEYEKTNYKNRYKNTSRTKKVDQLTDKESKYLITLRENEPNK